MKIPKPLLALLIALIALLSCDIRSDAQTPPVPGLLTIKVDGLKIAEGKLVVSVFRQGDDLFGAPFLKQTISITEPTAVIEFPNVPYSTYSVFAYHDINNNGLLDHNSLHIPKEPMGWSNHWHFGVFTGMPKFEKTKFIFSHDNASITISLK